MPKMKTKSSVKKRFRISKHGKAVCSHPARGHGHAPYPGKTSRTIRKRMVLDSTWSTLIRKMMGG
ncbi:MAG: 50S ribosomal protein L35 [Planctomycetes bacterium]|jgi:ribosomal protein L35|nr:50S ribosomal protein L35 [Planctomycetota bacterium]